MKIETTYNPGDDFVVLKVINPPLPDKMVSISTEALFDGRLDFKDQVKLATKDAEKRLKKHKQVEKLIK